MNKYALVLFLGIVMITSTISISFSEAILPEAESLSIIESFDGSSDKFVPGQIVVGLKNTDPYFNPKVIARGGQIINTIESLNAFVIKVPVHTEEKFISSISKNPNIRYAERDAVVNALFTPDDTYFNIQWGMQRIGMQSVWDVDRDLGDGIIVAVVDTGIYYDHPDFDGTNILTDIDYDFVDDDTDTRPTAVCVGPGGMAAENHSTFVSGIIAATKDNSLGVAGLTPVDILPIRVLGTCGRGSSSDVAAGITYAADNNADVINLSLGSSVSSTVILDAVNYAHNTKGVVLVAAAGNDGEDDNLPSYPASHDNVISVSAIARDDSFASYSQHVSSNELAAPGGTSGSCTTTDATYIVSTGVVAKGSSIDFTYLCGTGTSFAAPHVSGVAALIKASHPLLTNAEIRLHLQNTAFDLGASGWDDSFGYGLVMADVAVSTPFEEPSPATVPGAPTALSATAISDSQIDLSWTAPLDDGGSPITEYQIERTSTAGTIVVNTGSTATSYSDAVLSSSTTYTYKVSAINSVGTSLASNEATATTFAPATVPGAPTALSATAISDSQIDLSWTAPLDDGGSPITGYNIEKVVSGVFSPIATVDSTTTSYSDTLLSASTAYTYRVSAINSVGTSLASNEATATTLAPPTLQSILVTPADASIPVDSTQQYTATGTFSDTSTADITGQVDWASSDISVATIDAFTGLATAGALGGMTTISATSGVVVGSTTLTVTAQASDVVEITKAQFNTRNGQLRVDATSTIIDPLTELTIFDITGPTEKFIGIMDNKGDGTYQFREKGIFDSGEFFEIKVSSSSGGSATAFVDRK